MSVLVKCVIATLVFLAVYLFSFWVVFAQIVTDDMVWLANSASLLSAAAAAFWVWRMVGDAGRRMLATALYWAVVVGALGFAADFRTDDLHAGSEPEPAVRDFHHRSVGLHRRRMLA
jgi:hypothetical protein